MTCKKCGWELKRSDKFCPKCGEIVPEQKISTTKKVLIISLTVIVVAMACSIIIPIISVNSKPSQKLYNDTSRVFEENSKSTVKEALNESETESKTEIETETKIEKGIITGQVLDDLGNPIENAEVCAIVVREAETKNNAESVSDTYRNDSEITTKTDKEGKYSIECLVGEYKIQITADGYDGFISEKYVTVSTGNTVSIEKISLKSKNSEFDSLITNVINNEVTWIGNLEKEEKDFKDIGLDTSGNEYLWFQDMNMDGNLELVTMSKYFNDMESILESLDKKYLLPEVMEDANFLIAEQINDILKEVSRDMHEHVKYYEDMQKEYREYIEMWIHEIKTPIASSKLVIENNYNNDIVRKIDTQINKIDNFVEQVLYYSRSNEVGKDYIIKKVELEPLVKKVIKRNQRDFISKRISLELKDLEQVVYSDSKWIEFILNQIIVNAIKYSKGNNDKIEK